jgi:hypothetical protein
VAVAGPSSAQSDLDSPQRGPLCAGRGRSITLVFEIDLENCPNCGSGELKNIAAILEAPVIGCVLTHLGLQASAPPHAP